MITTDRVAVVILNWNGRDMIRQFLPKVLRDSQQDGLVVVVDNGSSDGSLEMLKKEFPQVKTIQLQQNYGFADGYNKALEKIDAPYYLLLNSDVETSQSWLQPLIQYMELHPEVAACQPKLLSQRNKKRFEYAGAAGGFIDRYGYPFCRGRIFGTIEEDYGQYDTISEVLWATGAALMVRRTDWINCGGLDGRFFAHMEEIDFCWRLRTRGKKIVCIPQSVAYHVGGATLNADSPRKTFLNFRNNLLMLYKNLPEDELDCIMRKRKWLDYLAALKFLLSGDLSNFKAVIRARQDFKRMLPFFEKDRKENMAYAVNGGRNIVERVKENLLLMYYLKGIKTFSKLMEKSKR